MPGTSIPLASTTESSGGEVSCSIEETNRIRISLGMKPLEGVGTAAPSKEQVEREQHLQQIEERKAAAEQGEIKARLARARKKRELNAKLKGASLGEMLAGEGGEGALDFVAMSRKAEAAKRRKAALAAERQRKLLDAQDADVLDSESDSEDDRKAAKARIRAKYGAKDLKGLAVSHDVGSFREGETVVMTLKDSSLLEADNGALGLAEDEDELMNVDLAEVDKRKEHEKEKRKMSRPRYMGTDDVEFDEDYDEKRDRVLGQYSEKGPKKARARIGASGSVVDSRDAAQKKAAKEDAAAAGRKVVSLDGAEAKEAESFYTAEEMQRIAAKKSKKKKGKKLRKKKRVTSAAELLEATRDEDEDEHHGSRSSAAVHARRDAKTVRDVIERGQAYTAALSKAEQTSEVLREEDAAAAAAANRTSEREQLARDLKRRAGHSAGAAASNAAVAAAAAARAAATAVSSVSGQRVYGWNDGGDDDDEEDDDADLTASLARARRAAAAKAKKSKAKMKSTGDVDMEGGTGDAAGDGNDDSDDEGVASVARAVRALQEAKKKQRSAEAEAASGASSIVFTATGEFSRSLKAQVAEQRAAAAEAERQAAEAAIARAKAKTAEDREKQAAIEAAARAKAAEIAKAVEEAKRQAAAPKWRSVGADSGDGSTGVGASAPSADGGGGSSSGASGAAAGADANAFGAEPLVANGMAATLAALRRRGELKPEAPTIERVGRANDPKPKWEGTKADPAREIHLSYKDEFGRELGPKEAFRRQAYAFHGYGSGKKKQEKRRQEFKRELKAKRAAAAQGNGGVPGTQGAVLKKGGK